MGQALRPAAGLVIAWQVGCATAQVVEEDPNYPSVASKTTWCSVPNYRFYRFAPTKVRGFAQSDTDPRFECTSVPRKPDGCMCGAPEDCWSGYCLPLNDGSGMSQCWASVAQFSEIEFWRMGEKVNTNKVPDDDHDAFRVVNAVDVPQTWGVWELEFYSDTGCTAPLLGGPSIDGGAPIASTERPRGFGHSIDHSAPRGLHATARTFWQDTQEPPLELFELHGPVQYAFDGDETTNWWPTCKLCLARTEWLGREYSAAVPGGVKCIRILQDKDREHASFSLEVQGRRSGGGGWDTFTTFNAATWNWGGVWEHLSIPQGVAFMTSATHVNVLDGDLRSSVTEMVGGMPLDFDFGVETEVDSWRWATAEEPADNVAWEHDGYTCNRDGLCPRDPVRWNLFGCIAPNYTACNAEYRWEQLQPPTGPGVTTDYRTTVYRMRWSEFLPIHHKVSIGITDIWPDGRGKCAARR